MTPEMGIIENGVHTLPVRVYFEDTDEDNNEPKLFEAFREDDFFKIEFTYYL